MRDTLQLMTLTRAQTIVKEIIAARTRWGKGVKIPYTTDQVFDALIVLDKAGNFDGGSKEDVTKLRRQLAACQNREKRYSGKGISDLQSEAEQANGNKL
jgi:hypothetical protein